MRVNALSLVQAGEAVHRECSDKRSADMNIRMLWLNTGFTHTAQRGKERVSAASGKKEWRIEQRERNKCQAGLFNNEQPCRG